MLPVCRLITEAIPINPYLLYLGLLLGASVGGNITPIGASANIVAMGILKKQGQEVRFGQFVRIGLPFTLAAVAASTLFGWLIWR
jgi:Na+/H+ antiporter NhaD/arsenite permease-like protein